MNIGVLGSGAVGATIATALSGLGHDVMMGSRSATNETAAAWVKQTGRGASQGTFADAAAHGEIVFNCTSGDGSVPAVSAAAVHLGGKTLIDVANPLDFSHGFPPSLTVCNTDSLAEQIQRAAPAAHVVKALNTMNCTVMVNPAQLTGDHVVPICGNDADAKAETVVLLRSFGWPEAAILDLGDLSAARASEMYVVFWARVYGALGTAQFNLNIVRAAE